MLLGARQFFARKPAPAWTNPYVTNGLVAMWDGEWNAGGGVHDANATGWTDLAGNHTITFSVNPSWNSDSLVLDGVADHAPKFTATDVKNAVEANAVTVEIVAKSTDSTAYGSNGFFGLGRVDLRSFWFWANARVTLRDTQTDINSMIEDGVAASYSLGTSGAFKNGTLVSSLAFGTQEVGQDFYIGRIPAYYSTVGQYTAIHGAVYSLRIYNRALTPAEIAANYAIDKARFNLP